MSRAKIVGLLYAFIVCILTMGASSNLAAQSRSDASRRTIVLPAVRIATDCITSVVSRKAGLTGKGSDAALSEAIRRVIADGFCEEAIRTMIAVYEGAYGPGAGSAFFSGPYSRDLPRAVRSRLAGTATTLPDITQNAIEDHPAPMFGQRTLQPALAVPAVSAPLNVVSPRQSKTQAEIEAEQATRLLMANLAGILMLAGGATVILLLIGLGSRWVVFADGEDIGRTASIVIAPCVTAAAFAFEFWRLTLEAPHTLLDRAFIAGHWTILAILAVGASIYLWGFLSTFASSIRHNGWVMGTVIAILKLTALVFVPLAIFGAWNLTDPANPEQRRQPNIAHWIIFGVVIWFGTKLINGPRVFSRREIMLHTPALSHAT